MNLFAPNFGLSAPETSQPVTNFCPRCHPCGGSGWRLFGSKAQSLVLSCSHFVLAAPLAADVNQKPPFIQINSFTQQPFGLYSALAAQFCFLLQGLRAGPALVCLPVKSN